jgi:hypothetical protein
MIQRAKSGSSSGPSSAAELFDSDLLSGCSTISLTTTKWSMEQHEQQPVIPELWIIREIVRRHTPEGHTLKNVDLSVGSLAILSAQNHIPQRILCPVLLMPAQSIHVSVDCLNATAPELSCGFLLHD